MVVIMIMEFINPNKICSNLLGPVNTYLGTYPA